MSWRSSIKPKFISLIALTVYMDPRRLIKSTFQKSLDSLFIRPSNNYAVLDGLRAMSILWVICSHVIFLGPFGYLEGESLNLMYENAGLIYSFWLNGFYGVDCFFVLSGFLISNIIFREIDCTGDLDLKSFYLRRIMRLSPALLVVCIFVYFSKLKNYEYILYNIFYINNFLPLKNNVMTHTWSLSVEEQFYIIFSIFMVLSRNSKNIVMSICLLILAALFIRFFIVLYFWESIDVPLYDLGNVHSNTSSNYIEIVYFKPYTRFGSFLFGVLAMYLYRYRFNEIISFIDMWIGKIAVYGSLVVILSTAFSDFYDPGNEPSNFILFIYHSFLGYLFSLSIAILMLFLLMKSGNISILNWVFSNRIFYPIAQLAYSLYLIHPLIIDMITIPIIRKIAMKIDPESTFNELTWLLANFSITLFIGLFFASIVYVLVERPFMGLRDVILRKEKS